MQTENDTPKLETELKQEAGEGCSGATCSALWEVQVKGQKCSSSWEISVIRKDNLHGHRSRGWFDATKLLVSHNGGPCSWPIVEFVWDEQIRIAHELCSRLNSGEIQGAKKDRKNALSRHDRALATAPEKPENPEISP